MATPPVAHRRRGADLEQAIRQAALEVLVDHGYHGLTMELVAARAGTGKAPLYRRWPSKRELVLEVIDVVADTVPAEPAETGSLRTELMQFLNRMGGGASSLAERAMTSLVSERRQPEIADQVVRRLIKPRLGWIENAIGRAVERHEIPPPSAPDLIARTGPALVIQHLLEQGRPPTEAEVTKIVDLVLLPALGGTRAGPGDPSART